MGESNGKGRGWTPESWVPVEESGFIKDIPVLFLLAPWDIGEDELEDMFLLECTKMEGVWRNKEQTMKEYKEGNQVQYLKEWMSTETM